jgi:hypothetical protein
MNIKLLTIFLLVLFISGHSSGQAKIEKSPLEVQQPDPHLLMKYQRMKNTGAALTVVGSVLFVVGYATMLNSDLLDENDTNLETGALCTIAGMSCLGPGIPMWIVGAHKHKKLSKLQTVTVKPIASTQYQGLTLSVRF